jgi:hypothetical protein
MVLDIREDELTRVELRRVGWQKDEPHLSSLKHSQKGILDAFCEMYSSIVADKDIPCLEGITTNAFHDK